MEGREKGKKILTLICVFAVLVTFLFLYSGSEQPEALLELKPKLQTLEQELVAFKRKQLLLEAEINQFKENSVEESENGLQRLNSKLKSLQEQLQKEKSLARSKAHPQSGDVLAKKMEFKQRVNEDLEEKIAKLHVKHKSPLRKSVDAKISTASRSPEDAERALKIRAAFKLAYEGYETFCLGAGEFKPIQHTCGNMLGIGMPFTVIDSLDTMLVMGLDDMFERNLKYLKSNFQWNFNQDASVFEMTIRCLGGFLSAYYLSGDDYLLQQAIQLGNHVVNRFDPTTDLPLPRMNGAHPSSNLAEIGSIQLEFSYLANLTGKDSFFEKPMKVYAQLLANQPKGKIYPEGFMTNTKQTYYIDNARLRQEGHFGIGSAKDSFYEYLLKYWVMTGQTNDKMKNWYFETMEAVLDQLGKKINRHFDEGKGEMYFISERDLSRMEHYTCFVGAVLALGANLTDDSAIKLRHGKAAAKIAEFCAHMYRMTPTGLPCDAVRVNTQGGSIECDVLEYHMRPEAVETWFYMYRLTGEEIYKEWAWRFFESIENYTKKEDGYTGLRSALRDESNDYQESFFLAETLKYLYLMFSDNLVDLSAHVFNTEAHIFPLITEFGPMPVVERAFNIKEPNN